MNKKQKSFLTLLIASISFVTAGYSQESVVVSGGNATGAGGTSSYSVGQVAYTNLPGSQGSVSQGVQQPYEIATLGNDEFSEIKLLMNAYPNPATDILNLVVSNDKWNNLSYNLLDINGRIISQNLKVTSSETKIGMEKLNQGIYLLSVNENSKTIKTFKIIKK